MSNDDSMIRLALELHQALKKIADVTQDHENVGADDVLAIHCIADDALNYAAQIVEESK